MCAYLLHIYLGVLCGKFFFFFFLNGHLSHIFFYTNNCLHIFLEFLMDRMVKIVQPVYVLWRITRERDSVDQNRVLRENEMYRKFATVLGQKCR